MERDLRPGKVFVDWSQNHANKSTAGVYSLRAQPIPVASTPVPWEELEAAVAGGDEDRLVFDALQVLARVETDGDLFAPLRELRQRLPEA